MYKSVNFVLLNVQGLACKSNNKLESLELKQLFSENDILLFTETWGNMFTKFDVDNFQHFELNRTEYKPNSKRSSGGLVVYIRDTIVKPNSTLSVLKQNDDIIWVKFDETNSYFSCNTYLCLCYNIPIGTSRQGMAELDVVDRIMTQMEQFKSSENIESSFIICGDFNARTGNLDDFVAHDSARHITALPDDYIVDNELKRLSQDEGTNENGYMLLDFCRQTGLRIVNGRIGEDVVGKCTYVGSRGSSLIDYVIVSQDLFDKFSSFNVCDPNIISDHCVINFSLCIGSEMQEVSANQNGSAERVNSKYVWDKTLTEEYKTRLSSHDIIQMFDSAVDSIDIYSSNEEIDNSISAFVDTLDTVCKPLFEKKKYILNVILNQMYCIVRNAK